jgi:ubiquinone/menaquinone biosynthesis C-methylase UbiE
MKVAWLWQRDIDEEKRTPGFVFRLMNALPGRSVSAGRAHSELSALGIRKGWSVLDFGCGPGSYSIAAAKIVGASGKVYAVDLHPKALEMVERKAASAGLKNIETIFSELETGLAESSVDAVLLHGGLGQRKDVRSLLRELHRVVKKKGSLHVRNSGFKEGRLEDIMVKDGLFHIKGSYMDILHFGKLEGEFHEI